MQSNLAKGGTGGSGGVGTVGGAGGNGGNASGGGMYTTGATVKVSSSPLLQSNAAQGGFGGVGGNMSGLVLSSAGSGGNGGNASGGALYATASTAISVILQNATVESNQTSAGPGASDGIGGARVSGVDHGGNNGNASGGGVYLAQNATLSLDTFKFNEAGAFSPAGTARSAVTPGAGGYGGTGAGGALFVSAGTVNISLSVIDSNEAMGGQGGPLVHGLSASSGGTGGSGRGGGVALLGGIITLSSCSLESNTAQGGYGGTTGGTGGNAWGGALYTANDLTGQSVTVKNCDLEFNIARGGNGGQGTPGFLSGPGPGGGAYGGGIYINSGTLHLTLDVVENNQANAGFSNGGAGTQSTAAEGGGLYKFGGVYTLDAFTFMHIINNTDSNNDAQNNIGP
jgi:hypothetical protein